MQTRSICNWTHVARMTAIGATAVLPGAPAKVSSPPEIGIGGRLAAPPLPHHRAYGSVPRRFDRVKLEQKHRGGEDRGRRKTGCAGPVGPPDVLTCARTRSV